MSTIVTNGNRFTNKVSFSSLLLSEAVREEEDDEMVHDQLAEHEVDSSNDEALC